jgi:hypothetical protein
MGGGGGAFGIRRRSLTVTNPGPIDPRQIDLGTGSNQGRLELEQRTGSYGRSPSRVDNHHGIIELHGQLSCWSASGRGLQRHRSGSKIVSQNITLANDASSSPTWKADLLEHGSLKSLKNSSGFFLR